MVKIIVSVWEKVPVPLQRWLKGAEVAVVTGVVMFLATVPFADFTTKAGITKFWVSIGGVAGGCMRLYMAQSPLQNVIKEVTAEKTVQAGGVSVQEKVTETTSGPSPTV
jgi:hypothetical protein